MEINLEGLKLFYIMGAFVSLVIAVISFPTLLDQAKKNAKKKSSKR